MNYFEFRALVGAQDTHYMRALYSQAYHETGNFKSSIFQQANNLFGMRPSVTRKKFYIDKLTTGSGKYAVYSDYSQSIKDRLDLDINFRRNTELMDNDDVLLYMQHVKAKGYATDPNYINAWLGVHKLIFTDFATNEPLLVSNEIDADLVPPTKSNKLRNSFIFILSVLVGFFIVRKYKARKK